MKTKGRERENAQKREERGGKRLQAKGLRGFTGGARHGEQPGAS